MVTSRERGSESAVVGVAIVLSAFLVSFGALHYGLFTKNLLLDTPLYEHYGDAVVHGGRVPYRNFALEYPPASLLVFIAPSLIAPAGDFSLYSQLFEGLMLVCGAVASALVAFVLIRERAGELRLVAGTLLAGLAPLLLGPVVLSRFDLWPAALAIAAVAALIAGRRRTAFALLAVGVAAKVYPLVLVPLAVVYVWRRDGARAARGGLALFLGVLALFIVPFLALSPRGVWASLTDQLSRPLQIESLGSSFLLAAHQLFGLQLNEVNSHGSDNLSGALPNALAAAQSLLVVAALVALWVGFARGEASNERLLRYAAAAVCAFVALGKVLSPQYLIWLFALVPLVRGRRGLAAGGLFVAALVLTQLWFPRHYIELVYGLDARSSWFVLARDITLVALLVTLAWPRALAPRAGVALVFALSAAAALAAAVAAATSPAAGFAIHSGLLNETGVASGCGRAKHVPTLSSGTVAYEEVTLTSPRAGGSCVTVVLSARRGVELFSAAYRDLFQPQDPQANYLGDAGVCTNVVGLSGGRLAYSLELPPGARFAVEVESCEGAGAVPAFLLDVHDGAAAPVAYGSASAARSSAGVETLRWRTLRAAVGTTFAVYRDDGSGSLAPVGPAVRARASGSYAVTDARAPLSAVLDYFIRARAGGAWSWYGPVSARG